MNYKWLKIIWLISTKNKSDSSNNPLMKDKSNYNPFKDNLSKKQNNMINL